VEETRTFGQHLKDIRTTTLRTVFPIIGLIAYVWSIWALWPSRRIPTPMAAWLGCLLLLATAIIGSLFTRTQTRRAAITLILGVTGAIACAVATFQTADALYLLIIPIILSGAVFAPWVVVVVGAGVSLLSIVLVWAFEPVGVAHLTPSAIFMLVIVVSLSSARSLRVLLQWALTDQERAAQNEWIARERQAELVKVLRSLDTATYNLERANYLLASARQRAEEAWRLKQQFAQNISHELRTPLNLVVGFTETMIQSPEYYGSQLPPSYLRDMTIVHRNACHLQNLVNDVLDLARIESAQMALITEPVDLAQLLGETIGTMTSHIEQRQLKVRSEIEPGLPTVEIDPVRIRQVVLNLLNNAMRFTDQGTITVRAGAEDGGIVVSVADTGIGIPPKELARIFDAFHQVDNTIQRRQGGAGLGLAISKRFVEMHGGRMWVESEVGQGSTFHFSLPGETAQSRDAVPYFDTPSGTTPARLQHERVMLTITSSPSAATMLSRYIRDCRPIFVDNLEQAQLVAQHSIPQMVLIDTNCISLSADELDLLIKDWGLTNTPFIGCGLPGEERSRHHLATSGYLVKPVSRETLRDVLTRLGDSVSRVLVVDDDRDFVRLLNRMLDHPLRRYQVMNAFSGREGLAMAIHYHPDVVLMDLGLPDIDGITLLDQIRSNPATQQIPIIIVSAYDEPDSISHLPGSMIIARSAGLLSGEVIQWVQKILDTTTQTVS